jgi:hypothetical protein
LVLADRHGHDPEIAQAGPEIRIEPGGLDGVHLFR